MFAKLLVVTAARQEGNLAVDLNEGLQGSERENEGQCQGMLSEKCSDLLFQAF